MCCFNANLTQVEISEGCTLRIEASMELDKPVILNGTGAPGTTGALVIAEGLTLTEKVDLQSNSASTISVLSGATLDLPDAAAPLKLDSPLTLNVAGLGAARISRLIDGPNDGDLIKEGPGSLFLNKNNTYTGRTIIRGGTVVIDGDQPDSAVLLDGGTVAGGVQDFSIGTISATAAGGTISVARSGSDAMESRSLTLNAATTFEVEFNGNQHDQLDVTGTVTLDNAILDVSGLPGRNPFVIIDNDSNDAVVGTFAGLPQGGTVPVGGVRATISYA